MLGYGGHCPWMVATSVAMAAFSVSPALVLSFSSFPFTADVAADALWDDLPQLMVQEKDQFLCCNNVSWRPVILLGKCPFIALSSAPKKGREKESTTWGAFTSPFLDCSGGFSLSFLDCSNKFHIMATSVSFGLSGLTWVLGLINGRRLLPLIFCYHGLLGSTCLGPSKQSLLLWGLGWRGRKNGPLQFATKHIFCN